MKKYLITGFSGFVSRFFMLQLENNNIHAHILGLDVHKPKFNTDDFKFVKFEFEHIDLLNQDELQSITYQFQPDYILHLASYSSVAFSWSNPILSFKNNTNIFLNLLEVVKSLNLKCRIISVGSSEEYGDIKEQNLPLKENTPLNPTSPYAAARVSQELLSKIYVKAHGLDIIMTRSFNHIGPEQKDVFVIPSFAKQLVNIKKAGLHEGEITVGDVTVVKDFTDVRDVVVAYYLLFQHGQKGETYNICSGEGKSLKEIISLMAEILNIQARIHIDPKLIRPNDNKVIIGCNEKIRNHVGWENKIPLKQSLKDILQYWERQS